MKTDLNQEQLMMIVASARQQRSIAAGKLIAAASQQTLRRLGRAIDAFLHALLMSPTARQ